MHYLLRAIVIIFSVSASSASATNNYTTSTDFTLTIVIGDEITLSVEDLTINNVVGGDIIDKDVSMISNKDPDRSATCSTTALTLTSSGETDITAITASVNLDCTTLSLDGPLPTSAGNGKTYAGTITITYAYDNQ